MKIAVCSDACYPVNDFVMQKLREAGHEVVPFGALQSRTDTDWVETARSAAEAVSRGECDEGIFFCWTGTGISIAANKIPGIRAALCTDAQTAAAARIWNHANVLALSNRLLTQDLATEILEAWLRTAMDERGSAAVVALGVIEKEQHK